MRYATDLNERIANCLRLDRVPVIQGWTTVERAVAMADLIVAQKPDLVVEIGVFGGRSLIPQAMAVQVNGFGVVLGIDPWSHDAADEGESDPANRDWWAKVDLEDIAAGCWAAITAEKLTNCTALIRARAEIISWVFGVDTVDILTIDGNHSELASCRDVELYLPLVRPGGHIWFDDSDWATTMKAIAMLDAACDRVSQIGACILFQKKLYATVPKKT